MGFPVVVGYALYLFAIFLPGLGIGELLGLWNRKEGLGLSARVALAFGLGLSIDTCVILVRTSGITLFGATLLGVDITTIYFLFWIGAITLIFSLIWRRGRFLFPVKPVFVDYALLAIIAAQAIMIFLYFQRYPIFPAFDSGDFHDHIFETRDMITGTISYQRGLTGGPTGLEQYYYPPHGILYEAVHYQLAIAFLLVNGIDLVTSQVTMSILTILGSLIFYLFGERLFKSSKVGLLSSLIYAITGMVWFNVVFDSGLDSNFYGILSVLFFIVCLLIYFDGPPKNLSSWIVLILAFGNLAMSHYSVLTVIPAVVIYVLFRIFPSKKKMVTNALRYGLPILIVVLGTALLLLFLPSIRTILLTGFFQGQNDYVSGSTFLSNALSGAPFLSNLALFVFDVPFVTLMILTIISLYFSLRRREFVAFSIPLVWFLSLAIGNASPAEAWRFSIMAIVPLNIVAGYGIYCLLDRFGWSSRVKVRQGRRQQSSLKTTKSQMPSSSSSFSRPSFWKIALILLITILPLLYGSWGDQMVVNSLTNTSAASAQQTYVYNAIMWLGNNTPNDSSYLAVSDWRFTYTDVLIGRETVYENLTTPSGAISYAISDGDQYLIVSQWIIGYNPPSPGEDPWTNFPHYSTQNLTLVYTNPEVEIFQVS
jgi:hypothetical protein